jgi:hypothetical protein
MSGEKDMPSSLQQGSNNHKHVTWFESIDKIHDSLFKLVDTLRQWRNSLLEAIVSSF